MTDEDAAEVEPEAESGEAAESDAGESGDDEERADALGPRSTSLLAKVAMADDSLADDLEAHLVDLESEQVASGRAESGRAESGEAESEEADAPERVAELEEKLQRTRADFQNYKKRAKKRREEAAARATEELVERLLSVRDNLSRALDDESGDAASLREGVELTLEEFDRVLADEGVEEIAPEPGSETDPNRHEVMMRVESDEPAGTVAEVFRPGYEMGGRVVRAAQVTVSEGSGDDE